MPLFQSILVCHDFSEPGKRALSYALNFAAAFGSKVHVYHALSDMEAYFGLQSVPFGTDIIKNTEDLLAQHVKTASGNLAVKVSTQVETGPAKSLVLKKIAAEKPDLVILGTHGRSGIKRLVLGSFAEAVVRGAARPLLLIRDSSPWPVKKILLPVEIGPEAETAVRTGIEVAQALGASIHLFHVLTLPDFFAIADSLPKDKQTDFLELIRKKAEEDLRALIQKHPSMSMTSSVSVGPIVEEISKEAAKQNCELVIIPTHARHGADHLLHGSTAGQILRYSPCPVMSFSLK